MRVGMMLNYSGGFTETVSELADFERAGLQIVFVPEAYSFDAVSQLGFIAARTTTVEIASGILPIYSRTPALTAMTAAGLDFVSGGRFTLGLGTSGPQVIEGWHGVPGWSGGASASTTTAGTTRSRCPPSRAPASASR
jgi:alkanesulfonate monooxygenase SsuD/methylene tetrahydromethanopterin reductase-like flavin-dependent oxidoreductase (luciferase family)